MKVRKRALDRIALLGLELAPPQVWGAIRIVPLLRPQVREDLRLGLRKYGEDLTVVALDGRDPLHDPKTVYCGYIPHAMVVSWESDGSPAAAFGCQLQRRDGRTKRFGPFTVRLAHRMVKGEGPHQLRMLPLHLAMEGFLALQFGGPDVAWSEYSREVLARGLGCRCETVMPGREVPGLADALRVFEIHEGQAGVLLFVADALASAFVVSHPDDYRALHRSLIEDFYGELMVIYGALYPGESKVAVGMGEGRVRSLAELRGELEGMRRRWAEAHGVMAGGILGREVISKVHYHLGPFQLHRFMTDLRPKEENHMGEAIIRGDGTLEYLKTYRLSGAQSRRAYLLSQLAGHNWNLEATAKALGHTRQELILRLDRAGFAYLLKEHIIREARAKDRPRR